MIHPVVCSNKVIIVAENWPCWLGCLLAVNTPVQAAFVTKEMVSVFPEYSHWLSKLSDFEAMSVVPDDWQDYVILGSGSHEFLRLIMPKLRHHAGPFIFANDMVFTGRRQYDLDRLYRSWITHDITLGLESVVVRHAEFGGVTSAFHVVSFRSVTRSVFTPTAPLPRTLRQFCVTRRHLPSKKSLSPLHCAILNLGHPYMSMVSCDVRDSLMSHGRRHTSPARVSSKPLGGDVAASLPRKCCEPLICRL